MKRCVLAKLDLQILFYHHHHHHVSEILPLHRHHLQPLRPLPPQVLVIIALGLKYLKKTGTHSKADFTVS